MVQPLLEAIECNNVELALDILAEIGKQPDYENLFDLDSLLQPNPNRYSKTTCLHESCRKGIPKVTEKLLELGASPNVLNSWKATPLHFAAATGNLKDVQILLKHGALVLSTSIFGRTPCHQAAAKGNIEIVECFLTHGFDVNNQDSKKGFTLLHHAAKNGHIKLVKKLVLEHEADVHLKDLQGNSALDLAKRECCELISGHIENTIDIGETKRFSQEVSFPSQFGASSGENFLDEADGGAMTASYRFSKEVLKDSETFVKPAWNGKMPSPECLMETASSSNDSILQSTMTSTTFTSTLTSDVTSIIDWKIETMVQRVKTIEEAFNKRLSFMEKSHETMLKHLQDHPCQRSCKTYKSQVDLTDETNVEKAHILRKKIQKNLEYLKENIIADDHSDYLLQEDALSMEDLELIEGAKTESCRVRCMMMILLKKKDVCGWVFAFIRTLQFTSPHTNNVAERILEQSVNL